MSNIEQVLTGNPTANANGAPTPGTAGTVARSDHNHGSLGSQVAQAVVTSALISAGTASATDGAAVVITPDAGFSQFVVIDSLTLLRTGASSTASSTVTITATFTDGTTASVANMQYQPAASSTVFASRIALDAGSSMTDAASLGWTAGGLDNILASGKGITELSVVSQASVDTNPFGTKLVVYGWEA